MRYLSSGKRKLIDFYRFRFGLFGVPEGQLTFQEFLHWFVLHSRDEGFHLYLSKDVVSYLLKRRRLNRFSRIELVIFLNRSKSDSVFRSSIPKKSFSRWLMDHGDREYPLLSQFQSEPPPVSVGTSKEGYSDVLIVCPSNLDTGIGRLVKNVSDQCQNLDLVVELLSFEFVNHASNLREKFQCCAANSKLVIYCLSLIEINYLYYLLGPDLMRSVSAKSIFYGPWELEKIPKSLLRGLCGVNEIWAISQFANQAFSTCHPNVVHIGIAIGEKANEVERVGSPFFQFLTVCATGSYLERKNPVGVLNAFLKAFPMENSTSPFRLRIHISDVSNLDLLPEFSDLDDRVSVTFGSMDRSEYVAMFEESQCYISLHRAEGFGHAIAEAINFGLPVIATKYGGITDFCTEENCYFIEYKEIEIVSGEYPYSYGLKWANPDLDCAVEAMKKVGSVGLDGLELNSLRNYTDAVERKIRLKLAQRICSVGR